MGFCSGLKITNDQVLVPFASSFRRAGITPDMTSEDLPLPEAPSTATNRFSINLATTLAVLSILPKKRCPSSGLKALRPGKGFCRSVSFFAVMRLLFVRQQFCHGYQYNQQ